MDIISYLHGSVNIILGIVLIVFIIGASVYFREQGRGIFYILIPSIIAVELSRLIYGYVWLDDGITIAPESTGLLVVGLILKCLSILGLGTVVWKMYRAFRDKTRIGGQRQDE